VGTHFAVACHRKSIAPPASVIQFQVCAFENCIRLRKLVLNVGLQEMERHAFLYCPSLELPSTPSQADSAFSGCKNLKKVVLNEGIEQFCVRYLRIVRHGKVSECDLLRE
jgi:hypothetical protein